jgi:type VI secretion system secreted protein Hcp
MAVDMFFKLAGIDGESVDKTHAKAIDVLAWSWGMSQNGTTHIGTGGGAGKVNVQDISFTKYQGRDVDGTQSWRNAFGISQNSLD